MTHTDFKNAARKHQVEFRKNVLHVGYDQYPNVLNREDANKGLVFFEPFREAIMAEIRKPSTPKSGQMLTNMLRSEHIPYNIFFPMKMDLYGTALLLNDIIGHNEVKCINDVIIEYAPKPIEHYLNDHTAFDVYISYINYNGQPCGIGIEVKYTEREYPLKTGSREYQNIKSINKDGKEITCLSKAYKNVTDSSRYYGNIPPYDTLVCNDLRQIWRNHILGASMVQRGDIDNFISILFYPKQNCHFSDKAIPLYESLLSKKGKISFIPLTYEALFPLLGKYIKIDKANEWEEYLCKRYIIL